MRTGSLGVTQGRVRAGVVVCTALVAAAAATPSAAYPRPGRTEPISVASDRTFGSSDSHRPSVSADGTVIAFDGPASNLVPDDTNGAYDVFVRDMVTGVTTRVSVGSDGAQGNGASRTPSISADGRYVAFASAASTLVPGDTNAAGDIFVHDLGAGTTQRVSVATGGAQADLVSTSPALSADGRRVAFDSAASTLVPGDTNAVEDVFVHDRDTGITERVSVAASGGQGDGGSLRPSMSADGRHVAFWSNAANLAPGDTNGWADVFVHDRETGATERVSVASSGTEGLGLALSDYPSMSADGRFVAFQSQAANLVPGDTNAASDVFVHDRETGATERVSVAAEGSQGNNHSYQPSVSADGRHVAFASLATNLVPGLGASRRHVFVRDRGPRVGVGDLSALREGDMISVSGWATFSGREVTAATDPSDDGASVGPLTARDMGAELTGSSLTYRPEDEDLLVRLGLAELPVSSSRACLLAQCVFANVGGGVPAVIYGLRFELGEARYEVRALRTGVTASAPAAPYMALFRCDPDCTEQARLAGGIGTTGAEVRVSIPLTSLGASGGGELRSIAAFTAVGEAGLGAVHPLDQVELPQAILPVALVSLGIAPAGTPQGEVVFSTDAAMEAGAFSGTVEASSLPAGEYEIWARACLGEACGTASRTVPAGQIP